MSQAHSANLAHFTCGLAVVFAFSWAQRVDCRRLGEKAAAPVACRATLYASRGQQAPGETRTDPQIPSHMPGLRCDGADYGNQLNAERAAGPRRSPPLLLENGWRVFGSTRSVEMSAELKKAGVVPVVVDVFEAAVLRSRLDEIRPDAVIHQLTDLHAGARRLIAQSISLPTAAIDTSGLWRDGTGVLTLEPISSKHRSKGLSSATIILRA